MRAWALSLVLLVGCTEPSESPALSRAGPVSGTVTTSVGGDAWLFLYRPGEGPPGQPAVPESVTAVSAARMKDDPHFVFAQVQPNPYRLYGLIDVDDDFDPSIDVLSQATLGDRVATGIGFQSQPGRGASVDLQVDSPVFTEPPAFSLEGEDDLDVLLDPALDAITPITLVSDAVGYFDAKRTVFTFGLVDADGDGRPDDVNGDGVPDLSVQLFLRWLPRGGQVEPGTTVLVPLVFDPSPILRTLEGRFDLTVTATRLQVVMVPQAIAQGPLPDGGTGTQLFGTPPAGDYELLALTASGQFWRVPNQLGAAIPSQGTRLHIDRMSR